MEETTKKTSNTTIVSGVALLALVGGIIGFNLLSNDDGDVLSWNDSNWLYRKSVSVANAGGTTLTNEDVLIEVDTATLISASKLQADCDDFRFIDSDDSSSLTYWIEGECNTDHTQIWVRIPSLDAAGTTIYMYYGNDSAVNAEASWTGNFILPSTSLSCPTDWTRYTAMDNRFPYGSATAETTGGGGTHIHAQTSCNSTSILSTSHAHKDSGTYVTGCQTNHTHNTLKVDIDSAAEQLPPYQTAYYCSNTDLEAVSTLPLFFDSAPSANWTQFNTWNDTFIYGGTTSDTGGTATHTHTTSGGYGTSAMVGTTIERNKHTSGIQQGSYLTHSHSSQSGTTGTASNLPAYLEVPLYTTSESTLSDQPIAMSTQSPPLGWTRVTDFDNQYIKVASSYNGTSQGSNSHTHSVTIYTGTPSRLSTIDGKAAGLTLSGHNHYHSCTTTTASTSYQPPYYTVIYSERNSSEITTVNDEVPFNTAPSTPSSLETEGETNPVNIKDGTPEFTAIFADTDTADTGDYYQIEVNTASDFTGTSMWDSTKTAFGTPIVNGARSSEVSYAGSTLSAGITYYWRIKFWDNGDLETSWPSAGTFSLDDNPAAPTGLLTDGQTNPVLLDDPYPYFSAIYEDPNLNDSSAYELEINTASNFAGTVMWDTGKTSITIVNNARSADIDYAGTPLSNSEVTLYWRIRFWDTDDNVSEWSATATFIDYYPAFQFEGVSMEGLLIN